MERIQLIWKSQGQDSRAHFRSTEEEPTLLREELLLELDAGLRRGGTDQTAAFWRVQTAGHASAAARANAQVQAESGALPAGVRAVETRLRGAEWALLEGSADGRGVDGRLPLHVQAEVHLPALGSARQEAEAVHQSNYQCHPEEPVHPGVQGHRQGSQRQPFRTNKNKSAQSIQKEVLEENVR